MKRLVPRLGSFPRLKTFALLPAWLATAACVGNIGDGQGGGQGPGGAMTPGGQNPPGMGSPGEKPGDRPGGKPGDGTNAAGPDLNAAGPMPLRRLSRREYNNTVRDLLGDNTRPADGFPPDKDSDFTFRRAGLVATL
ncbi:MAG TPA: DUF1587 domain-containing protein, partial [Polyangia bacterium]